MLPRHQVQSRPVRAGPDISTGDETAQPTMPSIQSGSDIAHLISGGDGIAEVRPDQPFDSRALGRFDLLGR